MTLRWYKEGLEEDGVGDAVVLSADEQRRKGRTGEF